MLSTNDSFKADDFKLLFFFYLQNRYLGSIYEGG